MSIRDFGTYDVVVAGGGPAGVCAAVAAARHGAQVLLLEMTGMFGGMATAGLVPGWCGFTDGERFAHTGLAKEILDRLHREMGLSVNDDIRNLGPIDAEAMKRALDRLVLEAGIDFLFFTTVADVELSPAGERQHVDAVVFASKQGLWRVKASAFIDATGDADLCALAGASCAFGDETGDIQPSSLCFTMERADGQNAPDGWKQQVIDSARWPLVQDDFWYPGRRVNGGHLWGVDARDVRSMTRAMTDGRELVRQLADAFRTFLPGSREAAVTQTAPLIGIRESRRVAGEFTLTEPDYRARRHFPDDIAVNTFFIDIHPSLRQRRLEREGKWSWEEEKRKARYAPGESHGIPFRCLIPKGFVNLLAPGRAISCDRAIQSAVRVMPPCMSMGEAAGIAAAQWLGADASVAAAGFAALDAARLREAIRAAGGTV